MVNTGNAYKLKGGLKKSIYRFGEKEWYDALKDGSMTESKRNFAKYIAYGAIVVFVLATDSFKELLRLL